MTRSEHLDEQRFFLGLIVGQEGITSVVDDATQQPDDVDLALCSSGQPDGMVQTFDLPVSAVTLIYRGENSLYGHVKLTNFSYGPMNFKVLYMRLPPNFIPYVTLLLVLETNTVN